MGTKDYISQLTGCPIKYKLFLKKHVLHHFTLFRRVHVFGPLPSMLAFRLTEFPQNREGYKKVILATGKTITNHGRKYTPFSILAAYISF